MNCFKNYNESRPTRHSRSKKYYGRIEKTGTIVAPPPERSDSAYGRSNADSSRLSVACQAWKKRRSIAKETKKSEREKGGQKVEEEAAAGNSIQPVGSLGSLERDIPDSRRRAWIILHGPLLTRAPLKNRAPLIGIKSLSVAGQPRLLYDSSSSSSSALESPLSAQRRWWPSRVGECFFLTREKEAEEEGVCNLLDYRPRYVKTSCTCTRGFLVL